MLCITSVAPFGFGIQQLVYFPTHWDMELYGLMTFEWTTYLMLLAAMAAYYKEKPYTCEITIYLMTLRIALSTIFEVKELSEFGESQRYCLRMLLLVLMSFF